MTYPCPFCGAPASAETGCPACGRAPDQDALEVVRTDAEIGELITQLASARRAVSELEARIGQAWQVRNAAAARVRAAVGLTAPKGSWFAAQAGAPGAGGSTETSTRTLQNLLFVLGGLLLGVAAIVFTAVAWAQFGVAGRATILASFTVAALAVPPLALRRGLRGFAETMAAVGLLLTLLDGYAAWYVNLFGVAGCSPARYAGAVFALTAALAAGYALATGLTSPRHAALLAFQPVLPLLVDPAHSGATGWALAFGGLAAVDVAVRRARVAPLAYALGGLAGLLALAPVVDAASRTVVAARPALRAVWSTRVENGGWSLPAALALVAAALFVALPSRLRPAALVAGAAAVALALPSGLHLPWWNGPILDLVVVAAALALAARRAAPALHTPAAQVAALAAAVLLSLHALIAGFGRPSVATGVLATIALLGFGLARWARLPVLAGAGLLTAVAALPAIAWTSAAGLGLDDDGRARAVAITFGAILVGASVYGSRAGTVVARDLGVLVAVAGGLGVALTAPAGAVLEAYTLPASGLALTASLVARRDHPSSWVTYGPALVTGLVPSLFLVLAGDGQPLRRLLLGIGALVVLLAGVATRLRAPVAFGAGALAVVAVHELAELWELIPRWIPLAAGGVVLVVLAATIEGRRRDLARFRQALGRMS